MSVLLKTQWRELTGQIWPALEKRRSAPVDMYIELLRYARRRLGLQVDPATDVALSDPVLARRRFFDLPAPQTEVLAITLIEEFYSVLQEFAQSGIAQHYRDAVSEYIGERNLRYTVTTDCRLRMSIPGLLVW